MSANLDCTDPAPCRGAHQVSLFAPRRWGELSPLLARARMNRRIIFSVMTRSRPSLRWALIPGRIINLARNNATCKCGQDLCMRRMKSCSAPKPFDQRARVSRMLSNCTEALSVLFHTRERDRDWAIYWSSLGQIVSQLRRAHRQPRDEKQSLLVLCVDRTLNALIDWSSQLLLVIRLPKMSESQKSASSEVLIGWLTSEILIWSMLFCALLCCSLKFGFHLL